MARLLQDRDSSALHLNLARRHQRLARRYRLAAFATTIETFIVALEGKADLTGEKDLDRQAAYDNVLAADGDQDDAVRNAFDAARIFDRDHADAPVLLSLFPAGNFGDITETPILREPDIVDALAVRVDGLGATHELAPHAVKLRAGAQGMRDAFAAQATAVHAVKLAEAEEEIAQAALRRQYENNYLDARKKPGRPLAERLFPRVNAADKPAPDPVAPPAVA